MAHCRTCPGMLWLPNAEPKPGCRNWEMADRGKRKAYSGELMLTHSFSLYCVCIRNPVSFENIGAFVL